MPVAARAVPDRVTAGAAGRDSGRGWATVTQISISFITTANNKGRLGQRGAASNRRKAPGPRNREGVAAQRRAPGHEEEGGHNYWGHWRFMTLIYNHIFSYIVSF